MKKDKKEVAYRSLTIKPLEDNLFCVLTHEHAADGSVQGISQTDPMQFFSVVTTFKRMAAELWRP